MQAIIDTDVFIEILRQRPKAIDWLDNLPSKPFLSGVAALEVSFGSRSSAESKEIDEAISTFDVLWPTDDDIQRATFEFGKLRPAHGIGSLDGLCAALALRHGLPILTFNTKHFRAVPGLAILEPYTR